MSLHCIQARPEIGHGTVCIAAATNARQLDRPINAESDHVLRFCSLFDDGRDYSFPCDEAGHVDLDSLSEIERANYFYARGMVGRDFSRPAVVSRATP